MAKRPENALPFGLHQETNATVLKSLPVLSVADAKAFNAATERKRKQAFAKAVAEVIGRKSLGESGSHPAIESWIALYEKHFPELLAKAGGAEALRALALPQERDGFAWLIVVLKGLTMNGVYDTCKKRFSCWRYVDNLDRDVTKNDRTSIESYGVWIRERIEADEELKNLSADDLASRNIKGVTLLERMLLELWYFEKTGNHLDIQNWTLCSGSRGADGGVPRAGWGRGDFRVRWGGPGYADGDLRCREVVSG